MYFKILLSSLKLIFIFMAFFWIVDHPGSVLINWHGYEIQTSVSFVLFLLLVLLFTFALIRSGWEGCLWILRKTFKIGDLFKKDTDKMIAQAFSDLEFESYQNAKKISLELVHLLPSSPIPGILMLKTAQTTGDKKLEEMALAHLKKFDEFVPMALYDEMDNAFNARQTEQLSNLIDSASKKYSSEGWFLKHAIRLEILKSNWKKALEYLDKSSRTGLQTKEILSHLKSICWHKMALQAQESKDTKSMLDYHKKSFEEQPEFLPNVLAYASLLKTKKDARAAQVLLQSAWQASPSWQIAQTYCALFAPDSKPLTLAHQTQELYDLLPDHPVSILILTIYLIKAKLWAEAHRLLDLLPSHAPEIGLLKAALAKKEKNDSKESLSLLINAIESMSNPYKCIQCQKATTTWELYCRTCECFDGLYLKHSITYKNCLEALTH